MWQAVPAAIKIAGVRGSLLGLRIFGLSDSNFSNNSVAGHSTGSRLAAKVDGKTVYELFRLNLSTLLKNWSSDMFQRDNGDSFLYGTAA